MRLKHYIWSLMAMLAMVTGIQQPLLAENKAQQKKHKSHSSSSSNKDDKCCKKTNKLLKQINETTQQDLVVDQTTLNVVNQINQTTRTDLAVDQETLEIVKHLEDCSCTCTVILPEDFEDEEGNLTVTYVITEPGSYCLGADVAFAPADEFTPAINILASDVRLDLRGFTLSQANDTPNAYGVQIGEGYFYNDPDAVLKNITVLNGSIIDFTAIGIFCYNGSFDEPTAEVAFEDIRLLGLNILDCGSSPSFDFASGIDLDSAADDSLYILDLPVAYKNVTIADCNINGCLGNGSVNVYTGDDVVIRDTNANDLLNTETVFYTFAYFLTCRNMQMDNCQGNNVRQVDLSTEQCGGLESESGVNVYVSNSQFNDAFGEASAIVNSNTSNGINHVYENCQFNNNRGGSNARNIIAGVHMSDSPFQETQGNGMKFINCQFNGTRVSDNAPGGEVVSLITGFVAVTLKNIVFENCQACNIITQNQGFDAYGFVLVTDPADPAFPFANLDNITFTNCVVSDITGGRKAFGILLTADANNLTGNQSSQHNMVLENCVVERISSASSIDRVAGIAECLYPAGRTQFPLARNLFIRDCRVSDVRAGEENPFSAGILVESVINPVLQNNSVSDCDRGILFTGTNNIIPNCFQLAATLEDALAFPPVFIPLSIDVQLQVQTDQIGLGPFDAIAQASADAALLPISAQGAIATPDINACTSNVGNMTGKIGINIRSGCDSTVYPNNMANAGAIATITGFSPAQEFTAPGALVYGVTIEEADAQALIDAIALDPSILITIDSVPTASQIYTFNNITQGNSVNANAVQFDGQHSFICPSDDLTALGWQPGDTIFFDCNGNETIPELECDTTYYAIVYSPGFSKNGLIQNNEVDNCSISCYQDDADTTTSAWVNNTAFNCGAVPTQFTNYDIDFAGVRPVDAGTLIAYPVGGNKYYNLSLVP